MKKGSGSSRSKSSAPARAVTFEGDPEFERPKRPVPKPVAATSQPRKETATARYIRENPYPPPATCPDTPKAKAQTGVKTEAEKTQEPTRDRAEVHQQKLLKMVEVAAQYKLDQLAIVPLPQQLDPAGQQPQPAAGASSSSCGEQPADEGDYGDEPAADPDEPFLPSDSEDEREQVEREVALCWWASIGLWTR